MSNKARITYRFDPKDTRGHNRSADKVTIQEDKVIPLYQAEIEVVEEASSGFHALETVSEKDKLERTQFESLFESHALHTHTTELGGWSSAVETEGDRVERIIRESRSEREHSADMKQAPDRPQEFSNGVEAPSQDHREEWTDWGNKGPWIEPEMTKYAKPSRTPWLRITASIAGAVVTGVAFGFFVLSMFSENHGPAETTGKTSAALPSPSAPANVPIKSVPVNAGAVAASSSQTMGQSPTAQASVGNVTPLQLPAKTYSFLQNGVFSSLQIAQAAQDSLKKKGLGSAIDGGDKPTVFVGFASTKEDALALKQQLLVQDKSLDVYIKNVDIPAVTGIRWSGSKPEAVASLIAEGDKLMKTISVLTVKHLAETKPTALADSSLQTIRTSHQTLTGLSASVNEGIADDEKPLVQKMTTALNSAVQAMEEYKKSPSAAMMWQAQSSLMQYIIAQKDLVKKIGVAA